MENRNKPTLKAIHIVKSLKSHPYLQKLVKECVFTYPRAKGKKAPRLKTNNFFLDPRLHYARSIDNVK